MYIHWCTIINVNLSLLNFISIPYIVFSWSMFLIQCMNVMSFYMYWHIIIQIASFVPITNSSHHISFTSPHIGCPKNKLFLKVSLGTFNISLNCKYRYQIAHVQHIDDVDVENKFILSYPILSVGSSAKMYRFSWRNLKTLCTTWQVNKKRDYLSGNKNRTHGN